MTSFLHPALRLLWRLQIKAGWRKVIRSVRTAKGILRLVLTLGLLALMFGPMIVFLLYRDPPDPTAARTFLEPGILLFTILTLLGSGQNSGVFFTPTEVDFLFPGPFNRRELLLYRFGLQAQASLFGALFLSVAPAPFVPHWTFAFIGIALVLQFIQSLSIVLSLTTSRIGLTAYTRVRKIALVVIAVPIAIAVIQVVAHRADSDVFEIVREFGQSTVGRSVLFPFQAFSRTITAERISEFVGWGTLAVGINAGLIALALRLDADFYERSVAVSEKVYRALERARQGQAWMNLAKPSAAHWRLPMPALMWGAGPIAWRQCVSALRSFRSVVYAVLSVMAALIVLTFVAKDGGQGMAIGGLAMFSLFMLPHMLQFDFRGDIEQIDFLKTLPASAGAIAIGELIVPILFATVIEWAVLVSAGLFWTDWKTIVMICAFVPIANLILFALENIILLYYPRRSGASTAFQAPGRQMVMNFIKSLILAVAAAITGGVAALAYWISQESFIAALVTGWCTAAGLGIALVPLVARAFRAMDPGVEALE